MNKDSASNFNRSRNRRNGMGGERSRNRRNDMGGERNRERSRKRRGRYYIGSEDKNTLQQILMSQVKPGITKYTLFMIIINGHSAELESSNGTEQEANKDFRLPLDILFLNGIYAGCTTLKGGFSSAELEKEMLKTINKGKKKGYDNFQFSKKNVKTENYIVIFNREGNASISEPYSAKYNATGIIRCDPIDLELTENRFDLKDIKPKVYVDLEDINPTNPRVPETELIPSMDIKSILLEIEEYYDFLRSEAVEPGTGILKLVMCCYCRGDLAPVGPNNNLTNFYDSNNNNFNQNAVNRAISYALKNNN